MYKILNADDFGRQYSNIFGAIYCGSAARRSSFWNQDWKFVLKLNSFRWKNEEFQSIFSAAKSIGGSEMVMTTNYESVKHKWSCIFSNNYESYVEAMRDEDNGFLLSLSSAMFDSSGRWGAIVEEATRYRYSIFGGENEFMDKLIAECGGERKMREEFIEYVQYPISVMKFPADLQQLLLSDVFWI